MRRDDEPGHTNARPPQETRLDDRIAHPAVVLVWYRVCRALHTPTDASAAILIWQGSVRTKKRVTVEDRLRSALGVSLAIGGVPQTKDGTIITSNNRAPTPPTPGSSHSTEGTDEKRGYSEVHEAEKSGREADKRRASITFGSVPEQTESRQRASTLAAPSRSPRPLGNVLYPVVSTDERLEAGVELKEIASRPRVTERHGE